MARHRVAGRIANRAIRRVRTRREGARFPVENGEARQAEGGMSGTPAAQKSSPSSASLKGASSPTAAVTAL